MNPCSGTGRVGSDVYFTFILSPNHWTVPPVYQVTKGMSQDMTLRLLLGLLLLCSWLSASAWTWVSDLQVTADYPLAFLALLPATGNMPRTVCLWYQNEPGNCAFQRDVLVWQ